MKKKIDSLEQDKPLLTVTVGEFSSIIRELLKERVVPSDKTVCGLSELAGVLGCGRSKVSELKRLGVLDDAVVSEVGRQTVFDVEKARALVTIHKKNLK